MPEPVETCEHICWAVDLSSCYKQATSDHAAEFEVDAMCVSCEIRRKTIFSIAPPQSMLLSEDEKLAKLVYDNTDLGIAIPIQFHKIPGPRMQFEQRLVAYYKRCIASATMAES